jgi:hypothetical protein
MPRHRSDTAEFDDLDFHGQARAMNMTALQFRKQLVANLRRAEKLGRSRDDVIRARLGVLQRIIDQDWGN